MVSQHKGHYKMPLENATYIADLEPTNPTGADSFAQGDDHLRLIKSAVKGTFPNATGAYTATPTDLNYLTDHKADVEAIIDGSDTYRNIPSGVIVMWNGNDASVPTGWLLCDGTNGTPDLRDRFILGAYDDTRGPIGSSHTATTSLSGSHNHGGTTEFHTLTVAEMPAHSHSAHIYSGCGEYQYTQGECGVSGRGLGGTKHIADVWRDGKIGSTGGNQGHRHSIAADGSHNHSVDTRGKHYTMAFIMKA